MTIHHHHKSFLLLKKDRYLEQSNGWNNRDEFSDWLYHAGKWILSCKDWEVVAFREKRRRTNHDNNQSEKIAEMVIHSLQTLMRYSHITITIEGKVWPQFDISALSSRRFELSLEQCTSYFKEHDQHSQSLNRNNINSVVDHKASRFTLCSSAYSKEQKIPLMIYSLYKKDHFCSSTISASSAHICQLIVTLWSSKKSGVANIWNVRL